MPRRNPLLTPELFYEKTERQENGCLLWLGRTLPSGYGIWKQQSRSLYVHRWAYETFVGPIPSGLTIEHMCHDPLACLLGPECPHRRCAEPTHLVPMTNAENSMRGGSPIAAKARQTHCIHGHPLSDSNLYVTSRGFRQCRACRKAYMAEFYQRRKQADV